MFQVRKMLRKLANDNREEEYNKGVLFAYFRPEKETPDWDIMINL